MKTLPSSVITLSSLCSTYMSIHTYCQLFCPNNKKSLNVYVGFLDSFFMCLINEESRAICRYICDKYSNQGNKGLYGTNPLVKASIDQWIEAEGQTFNPPSSIVMFQLFFGPRMKISKDENLIKKNEEKLSKVLDVYDKRLEEYRYLAGDEFTLADLCHLPNTQFLIHGTDRGELFTSRKNVARWWDEISGRESWKKVVEMQNPTPASV